MEVNMCEYDLDDWEIKKLDDIGPGVIVKKRNNIGGLFLCDKCNNIHCPGPCQNLGIDPTEFIKEKKKEQVSVPTAERIFELLRDKESEGKRVFGGRILLLILLIKGPLTAEEILKEVQTITENIRRISEKHKSFYIEFSCPESIYSADSVFGFVDFLQREVELGFLKKIKGKFAITDKDLDSLIKTLSFID